MTKHQDARLFSFAQFVQSFWQPTVDRAKSVAPETIEQVVATAQWIEAVFWMCLGVDLDFYPKSAAERLMNQHRNDLSSLASKHLNQLSSLVHQKLFKSLQMSLSGRTVMSDIYEVQGGPASVEVIPYYQSAMALARRMNEDHIGEEFRTQLSFANEEAWRRTLESPFQPELIRRFVSGELPAEQASVESLIAGFFKTLDAMEMSGRLFSAIRSDEGITLGTRSTISRVLGNITSWRIRVAEATTEARLMSVGAIAEDVLNYSLLVTGVSEFKRENHLQKGVARLIDGWLGDHLSARGANG
jgi:hypothetical protein